jgi:SAM-dependent methyltransferase
MLSLMPGVEFYKYRENVDIKNCFPRLKQILNSEREKSVTLFISNNAFHWFYDPGIIQEVIKNMNDILVKGGFIAISLAARGTPSRPELYVKDATNYGKYVYLAPLMYEREY